MKRFKNILLVADFNAKQQMAVDRAVLLAKQNKACLTVIHVVKELPAEHMAITVMPPRELFEKVIADCTEKADAFAVEINQRGVEVRSLVVTGTPFLEIVRQVLRDKHDLVILAAEGVGGIKERLFGSTSMHLMRKCPCPVWVVKPARYEKYKRILAAVDATGDFPDSERQSLNPLIIQLASSLAQMDNSEFHVVQAWSVFAEGYMGGRGGLSEESIRNLRQQTKREYAAGLNSLLAGVNLKRLFARRHLPRDDDPSKAIIKLAKGYKIDLLVMGTVCRTGVAGFFIGNTAEKVLSEVNCSVLTIKPEGFVTPVSLEEG
ncbi:MAG: universal stress protein [Mariprofundus sp.]|nr:universal stress protein [Mariprofundus sp.]